MKIVQAPHKVLNQKAKPVNKITPRIKKLLNEMKHTLIQSKIGVGLAAPQVGIPLQLFVATDKIPDNHTSLLLLKDIKTFINPQIIERSPLQKPTKKDITSFEGCLSLKKIWGYVNRSKKIKLIWLDEKGAKHTKVFIGFFATIIQHEIDHLNGILFTKRVLEQGYTLYQETTDKNKLKPIDI